MARYIDADAEIKKLTERHCKQDCIENHKCLICLVNDIQQYLDLRAETVEVKPVVHAHWIETDDYFFFRCSNCKKYSEYMYTYCPECGAIMDEEVNNGKSKTETMLETETLPVLRRQS